MTRSKIKNNKLICVKSKQQLFSNQMNLNRVLMINKMIIVLMINKMIIVLMINKMLKCPIKVIMILIFIDS